MSQATASGTANPPGDTGPDLGTATANKPSW